LSEYQPTQFGLYAGIGGFELAFHAEGFRCVGMSEYEPHAAHVSGHWFAGTPNFGDVRAGDFIQRVRATCGRVDVLTGGVPCQPASLLGKRLGAADERWLWDRTIEITDGLRPGYAVFENPPAILTLDDGRAANGIISRLAEIGFDAFWQNIPAALTGAGHLRERLFIIATNADCSGLQRHTGMHAESHPQGAQRESAGGHLATPDLRGRTERTQGGGYWWQETNTGVPVLADGLSGKLVEAACRLTGNAVVPQVVQPIARAIYNHMTHG